MLTLDGKDLLSVNQMNYLYNTVDRIIEDLSPKALNQLLEGYDNDIDKMLKEILTQAEKALYLGRTLDSESLDYIENVKASMDTTLKIYSLNYFILTMLPNFRMGWRNIEWGNMTQLFPWSSLWSRFRKKFFLVLRIYSLEIVELLSTCSLETKYSR
jgi:hypothetical protein